MLPGYLTLASQILIAGLFALSLDLIMGYAGIVSLGHAGLFGCGAYAAGILAKHGWGEPFSGLIAGGLRPPERSVISPAFLLRGGEIARLMVTLGICLMLSELANRAVVLTGGADGRPRRYRCLARLRPFRTFDLRGFTGYFLCARRDVQAIFYISRRIVASPFGLSLRGIRERRVRMPTIGTDVRRRLAT